MKFKLRQAIDWVSNIGLTDVQNYSEKLRYKSLNLTLMAIIIAFLLMIISDIIESNETLVYNIWGLTLTSLTLVLQHYGFYLVVRLIFSILFPCLLFVVSLFYGEEMNINYIYFAFYITALMAFESYWLKAIIALYILTLQITGIYYNRFYGSIIEKDIPLLDGILILILPTIGVGILVLNQVIAIQKLYDQQKKINEELQTKNIELTKLVRQNESKDNLLAIIAHDLKGPANSFHHLTKNIAFLIKKEQPERLEQMANSFEIAGAKLYHTISNLLNWVTSQRGDIVSKKVEVDLRSILDEVVEILSFQNLYKKVTIKYLLDELPVLFTDIDILKIILLNIINNAIRFSKPGGEVLISSFQKASFNMIEIKDEGPGMDAKVMEKILADGIAPVEGALGGDGHGIGLKICLALISHLGGKITIESEVGKGAVFGICIPC